MRIIETNVRVPDKVLADLQSQIAALGMGERDFLKQLKAYDVQEFMAYTTDLIDYAERLTRAAIKELPDGTVEFTDWNDDDGAGSGPVKFHVRLTVAGDEIEVEVGGMCG